jgi:hypothetical protein
VSVSQLKLGFCVSKYANHPTGSGKGSGLVVPFEVTARRIGMGRPMVAETQRRHDRLDQRFGCRILHRVHRVFWFWSLLVTCFTN